jgi:DNA-binding transcriptional LysR family regulator
MQDLRSIAMNLLVDLDALLATRSVTDAVRRVNLSQSAMSGSLARLRKLFGDPLLVRNGRTLTTTARAEALADPIREILKQVQGVLAGLIPPQESMPVAIAVRRLPFHFLDQPCPGVVAAQRDVSPILR